MMVGGSDDGEPTGDLAAAWGIPLRLGAWVCRRLTGHHRAFSRQEKGSQRLGSGTVSAVDHRCHLDLSFPCRHPLKGPHTGQAIPLLFSSLRGALLPARRVDVVSLCGLCPPARLSVPLFPGEQRLGFAACTVARWTGCRCGRLRRCRSACLLGLESASPPRSSHACGLTYHSWQELPNR